MLLILVTCVLCVNCDVFMITYDKPGQYNLTQKDYNFNSQIIVEIWGAGAGGNSGNYAGGGGSYIKAVINSTKTLHISVGKGGFGASGSYPPYCQNPTNVGQYGESSSITNDDINLIAGGGCVFHDKMKCSNENTISGKNILINENLTGMAGTLTIVQYLCNSGTKVYNGQGGNGAMGGIGGKKNDGPYTPVHGTKPGGGGSSNYPARDGLFPQGCAGNGGDGTVIIYFSDNWKPTKRPTHIPTSAPTRIPTNVPTNMPTNMPTKGPTWIPTNIPTSFPTRVPTNMPTNAPNDCLKIILALLVIIVLLVVIVAICCYVIIQLYKSNWNLINNFFIE